MSNRVTRAVEQIYQMDSDELNQVIEAIKLKRQHLARQAVRSVIVGDTVTFSARGRTVVGKVLKVNRKTLQVREQGTGSSTLWKVSATLVNKITEGA